MNIEKDLKNDIDLNYKMFQQKIINTSYPILGIKTPTVRKYAKTLLKEYNYEDILNNLNDKYFEEVLLKGLVIANAKVSYEEKVKLITNFLPLIDNWAICDLFSGELKFIKNNLEEFTKYIDKLLKTNKEYYQRFGIVCLLNYYLEDTTYQNTLNKIMEVKSQYYYVNMAKAWLISIAIVKHFEETIEFLKTNQNKIDKWTYNKALQKGKESLKITKEQKQILQSLKTT